MRVQNWPSLLYLHLQDAPEFEWGQTDCVLWCADWIQKAIGEDLTDGAKGQYSTLGEAYEYLNDLGFETPADLADEHLDQIQISYAQRGDIVLHPDGPLGICDGTYSHFLTETGKTRFTTLNCLRAWRV